MNNTIPNLAQLQTNLNGQKARQARKYIDQKLSDIYQASPEDLGPGDKDGVKREFNFVMQTNEGPWRDVKITINIAHAPHKVSPSAKSTDDPRQGRFDVGYDPEDDRK